MRKLLIIGNGFDLHHGMKTKFSDYRDFLIKNGKKDLVECYEKSDEITPEHLWNNLEVNISMLPYEDAYCYLLSYDSEEWRDSAHHDFQYEVEKMTKYWPGLKENLKCWIDSIEYTKTDESLKKLIEDSSHFLSFNYTNTLEVLYNVPKDKILYIHGDASQEKNLVLGHCQDDWYPEWDRNNLDVDIRLVEASEIMDTHLINTKKDIDNIIQSNEEFFNKRNVYNNITVIGLSYNETDMVYLHKLSQNNPQAIWHFYWHTADDYKNIDCYAKSIEVKKYHSIYID